MMSQSTTILVAGGAGEVGEGITRQLLAAGATVIVPSRSQDKLEQLKVQLRHPANLITKVADLSSLEGAERLRDELKADLGQLHHVVASLGGWWQGQPLTHISLELWHTLINNSLTAHFITAKTFIPLLQESKGSYTLINGGGALHPVSTAGPISASAALRRARDLTGRLTGSVPMMLDVIASSLFRPLPQVRLLCFKAAHNCLPKFYQPKVHQPKLLRR
jgi:NAD(P)-dependent dehydrogenase (short-subunit alcohol dehydrogenase family)